MSLYEKMFFPMLCAVSERDAEIAHELAMRALENRAFISFLRSRNLDSTYKGPPVNIAGVEFKNPVGLAAGLTKNGGGLEALDALGFGSIEVGTVVPEYQRGNKRPRLFRLKDEKALINRMGFNSNGVESAEWYLNHYRQGFGSNSEKMIGVNIGKNASTSLHDASDDYVQCIEALLPYADYVVGNVSSPNTVGLRDLQHGRYLRELIESMSEAIETTAQRRRCATAPLFIKISPDMSNEELGAFCENVTIGGVDAIITTNTTNFREGVEGLHHAQEVGGLSGKPLCERSLAVTKFVAEHCDIPVISVGGIDSADDIKARLENGASAVQLYTGLVYKGPWLVSDMMSKL